MHGIKHGVVSADLGEIGRPQYDWCMTSVPVPTAGNKTYSMPRGKLLGGSSGINYLMYVSFRTRLDPTTFGVLLDTTMADLSTGMSGVREEIMMVGSHWAIQAGAGKV